MEKCPECGGTQSTERVELLSEPFEGRSLTYGTKYQSCAKCKVTWYSREQMAVQRCNRRRAIFGGSPLEEALMLPRFRKLFFAGNVYPKECP